MQVYSPTYVLAATPSVEREPGIIFPKSSYYSTVTKCFSNVMEVKQEPSTCLLPSNLNSAWKKTLTVITDAEERDLLEQVVSCKYYLFNSISFLHFWHFHLFQLFRKVGADIPANLNVLFETKMKDLRLLCMQNIHILSSLSSNSMNLETKKMLKVAQNNMRKCQKEIDNFYGLVERFKDPNSPEYLLYLSLVKELKTSLSITTALLNNNPEITLSLQSFFEYGCMADPELFPAIKLKIDHIITQNELESVIKAHAFLNVSSDELKKVETFSIDENNDFTIILMGAPLRQASFHDYMQELISYIQFTEESLASIPFVRVHLDMRSIIDQLRNFSSIWEKSTDEQRKSLICQIEENLCELSKKYQDNDVISLAVYVGLLKCQKTLEENVFNTLCDSRFEGVWDFARIWKVEYDTFAIRFDGFFDNFPKNNWELPWFKNWRRNTNSLLKSIGGIQGYKQIISQAPYGGKVTHLVVQYAHEVFSPIVQALNDFSKPQIEDSSTFSSIDVNSVYASYLYPMLPYLKLRTLLSDLELLHAGKGYHFVSDQLYNWPEDLIEYVLSLMETIKAACPLEESTSSIIDGDAEDPRKILRKKLIEILHEMSFFIDVSDRPSEISITVDREWREITISRQKTEHVAKELFA